MSTQTSTLSGDSPFRALPFKPGTPGEPSIGSGVTNAVRSNKDCSAPDTALANYLKLLEGLEQVLSGYDSSSAVSAATEMGPNCVSPRADGAYPTNEEQKPPLRGKMLPGMSELAGNSINSRLQPELTQPEASNLFLNSKNVSQRTAAQVQVRTTSSSVSTTSASGISRDLYESLLPASATPLPHSPATFASPDGKRDVFSPPNGPSLVYVPVPPTPSTLKPAGAAGRNARVVEGGSAAALPKPASARREAARAPLLSRAASDSSVTHSVGSVSTTVTISSPLPPPTHTQPTTSVPSAAPAGIISVVDSPQLRAEVPASEALEMTSPVLAPVFAVVAAPVSDLPRLAVVYAPAVPLSIGPARSQQEEARPLSRRRPAYAPRPLGQSTPSKSSSACVPTLPPPGSATESATRAGFGATTPSRALSAASRYSMQSSTGRSVASALTDTQHALSLSTASSAGSCAASSRSPSRRQSLFSVEGPVPPVCVVPASHASPLPQAAVTLGDACERTVRERSTVLEGSSAGLQGGAGPGKGGALTTSQGRSLPAERKTLRMVLDVQVPLAAEPPAAPHSGSPASKPLPKGSRLPPPSVPGAPPTAAARQAAAERAALRAHEDASRRQSTLPGQASLGHLPVGAHTHVTAPCVQEVEAVVRPSQRAAEPLGSPVPGMGRAREALRKSSKVQLLPQPQHLTSPRPSPGTFAATTAVSAPMRVPAMDSAGLESPTSRMQLGGFAPEVVFSLRLISAAKKDLSGWKGDAHAHAHALLAAAAAAGAGDTVEDLDLPEVCSVGSFADQIAWGAEGEDGGTEGEGSVLTYEEEEEGVVGVGAVGGKGRPVAAMALSQTRAPASPRKQQRPVQVPASAAPPGSRGGFGRLSLDSMEGPPPSSVPPSTERAPASAFASVPSGPVTGGRARRVSFGHATNEVGSDRAPAPAPALSAPGQSSLLGGGDAGRERGAGGMSRSNSSGSTQRVQETVDVHSATTARAPAQTSIEGTGDAPAFSAGYSAGTVGWDSSTDGQCRGSKTNKTEDSKVSKTSSSSTTEVQPEESSLSAFAASALAKSTLPSLLALLKIVTVYHANIVKEAREKQLATVPSKLAKPLAQSLIRATGSLRAADACILSNNTPGTPPSPAQLSIIEQAVRVASGDVVECEAAFTAAQEHMEKNGPMKIKPKKSKITTMKLADADGGGAAPPHADEAGTAAP